MWFSAVLTSISQKSSHTVTWVVHLLWNKFVNIAWQFHCFIFTESIQPCDQWPWQICKWSLIWGVIPHHRIRYHSCWSKKKLFFKSIQWSYWLLAPIYGSLRGKWDVHLSYLVYQDAHNHLESHSFVCLPKRSPSLSWSQGCEVWTLQVSFLEHSAVGPRQEFNLERDIH